MKPLAPRQLAHRGVVEAAGFAIDARLLGEEAARRRVVALWGPASRVRALEHGWLVLLPAKARIACSAAPGTPLVAEKDLLLAAPLERDELEALAPAPRSAVLVEKGTARVVAVESLPEVDPADWIDPGAWTMAQVEPLGAPPEPPKVAVAPLAREIREVLGGKIPPRSAEADALLAALRREQEGRAGKGSAAGFSLGAWLAGLMRSTARWLERRTAASQGAQAGGTGPRRKALPAGAYRPPGWTVRAAQWLESAAARLFTLAGPLARALGRRHAEYLDKMMDLFKRGDLTEALRHAIPLGKGGVTAEGMALGLPAPRTSLLLNPFRSAGGLASPFSGPELYAHLHSLYRRAFERLRDAGRIDEAAFVLSELLGADEEAVSFLEQHGRLELAARMAEARELAPGLVVRQWLVAGNAERALAIALRTGAFADACARLQRTHPQLAATLRLHWAEALAKAGDFAAAVDAVLLVPTARRLALEWADRGIAAGGVAGARLLARRLELDLQCFEVVREPALALCEDESAERSRARVALGRALLEGTLSAAVQALARPVARALLRDQAAHGNAQQLGEVIKRLAEASGDRALVADLQPARQARLVPLAAREPPLVVDVQEWDTGTSEVRDAAMLPGGQVLLALGEAGARLVTRDGRTAAHFDQPAGALVVAESGLCALALARRGEATRIARLDLATRRASHLRDACVDAWARDFDGAVWWVARGERLSAVGAQSAELRELWQVDRMGGRVAAIARSRQAVTALVAAQPVEAWTYELPRYVLRQRAQLEADRAHWLGISALGVNARVETLESGGMQLVVRGGAGGGVRPVAAGRSVGGAAVGERLVACAYHTEFGMEIDVLDVARVVPRASVILRGAGRATVRLQEPWCLVADDRGRLIVIDVERGEVVRDLRV